MPSTRAQIRLLDDAALRAWPLPQPSADGDKQDRGSVLIIAGSPQMPGAAVLAATAALRAGAGKLAIATVRSAAHVIALAVPEARVIGLPETASGGVDAGAADSLSEARLRPDAVVIGPGMQDEDGMAAFVGTVWPQLRGVKVVLDALAMSAVHALSSESYDPAALLLTPHAGEMAHLTGNNKEAVRTEAAAAACAAADRFSALVALKGATTYIAVPQSHVWKHDVGNIGLGSSGSGDVLAGIIGGLAARGATLEQAAAWGVALHARAGDVLAKRVGYLGYLAREIAAEVPSLMQTLAR
jgi:hydroxyethylthiazole kinase-like uncharacterized protein yjeF